MLQTPKGIWAKQTFNVNYHLLLWKVRVQGIFLYVFLLLPVRKISHEPDGRFLLNTCIYLTFGVNTIQDGRLKLLNINNGFNSVHLKDIKLKSGRIPLHTPTKEPVTLSLAFLQTLHCDSLNTLFWVYWWTRFLRSFIIFKDIKKFSRSLLLLQRSTFFPPSSSFYWFYRCSHKPAVLLRDYKSFASGLKTLAECQHSCWAPLSHAPEHSGDDERAALLHHGRGENEEFLPSRQQVSTRRPPVCSCCVTVDVDGGRGPITGLLSCWTTQHSTPGRSRHKTPTPALHLSCTKKHEKAPSWDWRGNLLFIYLFLDSLVFSSPWKLEQQSVQVWLKKKKAAWAWSCFPALHHVSQVDLVLLISWAFFFFFPQHFVISQTFAANLVLLSGPVFFCRNQSSLMRGTAVSTVGRKTNPIFMLNSLGFNNRRHLFPPCWNSQPLAFLCVISFSASRLFIIEGLSARCCCCLLWTLMDSVVFLHDSREAPKQPFVSQKVQKALSVFSQLVGCVKAANLGRLTTECEVSVRGRGHGCSVHYGFTNSSLKQLFCGATIELKKKNSGAPVWIYFRVLVIKTTHTAQIYTNTHTHSVKWPVPSFTSTHFLQPSGHCWHK